ncbi:MAG: MarR family EPS-associated transcriptional regulator [Acidobacteriota bacterium]|nr:MarR family EPS-associated transcriptional regulator [Acidobacteriota bacterium]
MPHSISDEIRYRLLHYLEEHPQASQRELAQYLDVSVGKVNYCIRALIAKGLVKMRNFRGSRKKLAYAYVLTPKGLEEKVNVTAHFLKRKLAEYDSIVQEIERLTREVAVSNRVSGSV